MAKPPRGVELAAKPSRDAARLLTSEALGFVADLQRGMADELARRREERKRRQAQPGPAELPDIRPETAAIRAGRWAAHAPPRELADLRTVVVAAPSRRELLIGLNSGARLCIADFRDSIAPSFDALTGGQLSLMERWTSAMEYVDPETGKRLGLAQRLAAVMVRPRPLTMDEPRLTIDGKPVSAGLFDAGLYLFHNAATALAKASGPYLCLAGIDGREEARAWNDLILHAQGLLSLPAGTVRVGLGADSARAAFAIEDCAYELREHVTALFADRTRIGFALIGSTASLKGRAEIDIVPAALDGHLIQVAHRRGCLAVAHMLPGAEDARAEAEQAVRAGYDGLVLAQHDQVSAAARVFGDDMPTPNQLYVSREDALLRPEDVFGPREGAIALQRFAGNVHAAVRVLEAWLGGRTPLPAGETLATAEFRRAELWHWIRQGCRLDGGGRADDTLFEEHLFEALRRAKAELGDAAYRDGRHRDAAALLRSLVLARDFAWDVAAITARKPG